MHAKTPVEKLSALFIDEYKQKGYSALSIVAIERVVTKLVMLHRQQGEIFFREEIADSLISEAKSFYGGRKSRGTQLSLIRCTTIRLKDFHKTGTVVFRTTTVKEVRAAPALLALLSLFAESKRWTDSIRHHIGYNAKLHFEWLTANGVLSIEQVTLTILRDYLCHRSKRLSGCGMKDTMFSLKQMYRYLFEEGYTTESFEGILSFQVTLTKKYKPALPEDEISTMLQSIDRSTAHGKRNYALLILAYITGLRASDIAALKLSNIDWKIGEIRIIQRKTGRPLTLPLTEDVGFALKDYILNGRPDNTSQNVFLCTRAPYAALSARGGIRSVYESVRTKAGLTREPFDGKSFHAFRRTVGKNMVIAGMPLADVSQMLGHASIESAKAYIPLDRESLKGCALGFDGLGLPAKPTIARVSCALDLRGIDPASCKERIPCCALNFCGIERQGGAQW